MAAFVTLKVILRHVLRTKSSARRLVRGSRSKVVNKHNKASESLPKSTRPFFLCSMLSCAPDGTYYRVAGSGPPVVLLHGLGLDHQMWCRQVAGLHEHHKVVAMDLLGHGKSLHAKADVSLDDLVTQVTAVLTHSDLQAATLVGFDLGGLVAMSTAAMHPEKVAAVALISTPHGRLKAQRDLAKQRVSQAARYVGLKRTLIRPSNAGFQRRSKSRTKPRFRRSASE